MVDAQLSYLAPGSTVLRRFTAPGNSVNTGVYRIHTVPVHNGRDAPEPFTLDTNGFALVDHTSVVRDPTDRDEVDRLYLAEVAEFLAAYTGADRVVPKSWLLRRAAAPGEHASQPHAALVHDDYSDTGARWTAEQTYATHVPDGPGYRRALITSLWRVFSPPPQDWPLAVCDHTSVGDDEGIDNRLCFVDEIPDDLYAEPPDDAPGTSGSEFHHNARHRWWYFPDMTRDEILVLTLNDTDHTRAWRVPHSAFHDPTVTPTEPRHSIEVRSVAFFE